MRRPKPRLGSKPLAARNEVGATIRDLPPVPDNYLASFPMKEHPGEPPGERLRLMRERLGPPSGIYLRAIQVTPIREPLKSMKKLKAARQKVEQLSEVVRSEAFDDWLATSVVKAERPDEWTRARVLYEGYLRCAGRYGNNRADKRLSIETLATETAWGRMMGSLFPNKQRRRDGFYYPIRLKRGA